ncbi:STAS domain-containing protein [Streptomyces sp. AS58]|uniref:STAS domain-containing protein n=1 Tax=Streptomyces sp. AS58 TaxID=1519489 RepID=UPI0006AE1D3C|nr:STAS domain-containing protein [Streptomyces sp. AS58]
MTRPLHSRLGTAAAWLVASALATTALLFTAEVWAQVLCAIVAAAALRTALTTAWRATREGANPPGTVVVRLRGTVNHATADRTSRRLADALAARPAVLVIDMSEVDLLTNAGATALLTAAGLAHRQSIDVVIHHASPQARTTLRTLGLDRYVEYRNR